MCLIIRTRLSNILYTNVQRARILAICTIPDGGLGREISRSAARRRRQTVRRGLPGSEILLEYYFL